MGSAERDRARVPSTGTAPGGFTIAVKRQGETAEIIPAGELDLATIGQLQSELEKLSGAGFARVLIDLRGVEFIDSTGLHALLDAHRRATRENWQLSITPGSRAVQRLFEITGVIDRLPFTALNGKVDKS